MSTPQIRNNIKRLQADVRPYRRALTGESSSFAFDFSDPKKVYLSIPLILLVVLLLWRPGFLYIEDKNDKQGKKKFSFSRLVLSWLIFSLLLCLGYFGYSYKK